MANNKIYVGNISYSTEEEELRQEFSECGEIEEINVITDRETGRSKGFAFITFKEDEAATASLEKNGKELQGRNIRVNIAEDRKRDSNRQFGGGGGNRRF